MSEKFDFAKYNQAYQKENYKRIALRLRAEDKERLDLAAAAVGKSINKFISDLIAAAVPGIEPLGYAREKAIPSEEAEPEAQEIIREHTGERLSNPDGVTVTDFAHSIHIGRNVVFDALRGGGYLQSSGPNRNMPTEKSVGLIAVRHTLLVSEGGSYRVCQTPIITPDGQEFFREYFRG